jgi:hypothetical protein
VDVNRLGLAKCNRTPAATICSTRERLKLIDLFSLGLTHALLLLAAWRLVGRSDLDQEQDPPASA